MFHLIMSPQVHKDTSDIRVVERSFAHVQSQSTVDPLHKSKPGCVFETSTSRSGP